jgi:hypothetical protein
MHWAEGIESSELKFQKIMMKDSTQIKCPNCGTTIDVQDVLAHQLEDQIKQQYQAELAAERKKFESQAEQLNKAKEAFAEQKRQQTEQFQEALQKQLRQERQLLQDKIKRQLQEEQSDLLAGLQKELNEKSEQVKELNKSKAEIERLKRESAEAKEAAKLEAQKELNAQLLEEKEKIRLAEEQRNELKFKELQKQLEDQKKLTAEMKRKQEQGSMQMQGEVQELAIEEWLESNFPLDTIDEIKKGARGGDCIQIVNTRTRQNCGTIYYESKRTKDFQPSWIEKFKADMRDKGADIGVLVTEAMPSDMDRMGLRDGVWVCTYEEFKGLSTALRESVIKLSLAISSQENKGDKMNMLYDFLTSNTFRMQIDAIVEGFTQMKKDLESEKRSMQRIWKQREKQIEKVVTNTIDMYGSIKGIAGNAIQSVQALELPGGEG